MREVLEIILLFLGGFLSGSYGAVVGGGALASFTALLFVGLPVDVAIATNRFQFVFMMASSIWAFVKKKAIYWRHAIAMGLVAMPMGVLGAKIVSSSNEELISIMVAIALGCIALLLSKIDKIRPSDKDLRKDEQEQLSRKKMIILLASVAILGVYGGFYGVGFGTFVLFLYMFLTGKSFLQASANAKVVNFAMSSAATIFFISQGLVSYSKAAPMIIGAIIGAQFGVHYAYKIDPKWIKRALLVVIFASAAKLIIDAI